MNTERLLELADIIERTPHREIVETYLEVKPTAFNMGTWHCGAVCCIGGWAEAIYVGERRQRQKPGDPVHAAWVLGLDELTADQLFYPNEAQGWEVQLVYADITPAMAARVIRNLAKTGVVDWSPIARQLEHERERAA